MNIPFPVLYPRLVDSKWFTADNPVDEDAELTALEQQNQNRLNSIGQRYMKKPPLGKPEPEPMEEADTDEEEGNEESDESEESHDEDEDVELRTTYSPPRNNNETEPDRDSLDYLNDTLVLNTSSDRDSLDYLNDTLVLNTSSDISIEY
ncbi:anaphase-promoting complex subunit 15-like [Ostrinia nubilalis]|uniref:anaphase-promoting complex subunit 15-like n=1 Tax=Ostrinia nubilalis TaxID=29057 RepID=UPI0030823C93